MNKFANEQFADFNEQFADRRRERARTYGPFARQAGAKVSFLRDTTGNVVPDSVQSRCLARLALSGGPNQSGPVS